MRFPAVALCALAACVLTGCAGGLRASPADASAADATSATSDAGPVRAAGPTGDTSAANATGSGAATLDGAALLQRTCTVCHGLDGLRAYADYWGEPEWRSMVETMMDYGAVLTPEELPVLVRYLATNYGTAGKDPGSR